MKFVLASCRRESDGATYTKILELRIVSQTSVDGLRFIFAVSSRLELCVAIDDKDGLLHTNLEHIDNDLRFQDDISPMGCVRRMWGEDLCPWKRPRSSWMALSFF